MFGTFRFILAYNVVLFHIIEAPAIGPMAVYSFFILSGFLMTLIMHKTYSYSIKGFTSYLMNRFYRLFPIYWCLALLSLVIFFLIGTNKVIEVNSALFIPNNITHWLANITLIYPMYEPVYFPSRIAPATWALTIEIFFYLLIGLGLSKSFKLCLIWLSVSIAYVLYQVFSLNIIGFGYGNIFAASLPFSLGASLFFLKDKLPKPLFNNKFVMLLLVLFTFNLIAAATEQTFLGLEEWKCFLLYDALNIVLSAMLIIVLSTIRYKPLKSIDSSLGDLSYPVYIFHWTGACMAYWLLGFDTKSTIAVLAITTTFTLVISVFTNKFIGEYVDSMRDSIKRRLTE